MKRAALMPALLAALLALATPARPGDAGWMSPGPTVPRVTLLDESGQGWRLRDLVQDRPVLIGFFFTGCTTVCPLQTVTMQAVQQELVRRSETGAAPALLLSISVDPIGDTPTSMQRYAEQFDLDLGQERGWLMLTGAAAELEPVWSSFDEGGAAADHTAILWIGQPDNRRWTRVSAMSPPERIADLLLEPGR